MTIPNSVTSIGNYAFYQCLSLTNLTIPNSVTSIGERAFSSCSRLTSVTIPNSVTSIGDDAFYYCYGLTSVTIPNSVTSIGSNPFSSCYSLTSISVSSGNAKYDSRNNCNAIIETASNTLISGCTNTTIPNSVTSIGNSAFEGCYYLRGMTIPNSVTSIGNSAFESCSNLTSVTIPNSVTSIGNSAFKYCSGLTSVTIPNSVTSIGDDAFSCSNLTSVTVEMETPVGINSYTFSNRKNAMLYVPYGCKAAYEAADYWKEFKEIVEMEPTNNSIVLDENSTDAPNEASDVDVLVKRTLNAGEWSTICLPFAMTAGQMKEAFGEGVQVKDFTGYEVTGENSISVKFSNVTSMEACHPYIIKVEEAVTEFTVDGVDIVVSNDPRVSYGTDSGNNRKLSDFVGTLVADFNFYEDATNTPLFLSGGQFWYASEQTQTMKAFRAYFDFDDDFADEATSRISMEFVDNEQVGVDSAIMNNEQCTMNNEVYDLQGRKVENSQLQVGLYIKNGKKIIIK